MSQETVVGTPKYLVECRKKLFSDNFADGVADESDWEESSGTWSVETATQFDGDSGYVYEQSDTSGDKISYCELLTTPSDYYFLIAFKIKTSSGSIGLLFRKSGGDYYSFKVTQGTTDNLKLELDDGTQVGDLGSATIAVDTWYMARVNCSGTSITCSISTDFVNFTDYITETDSTYSSGTSGLKTYSTNAEFDEIELYELKKIISDTTNSDMASFSVKGTTSTQADFFQLLLSNTNGANTSLFQPGYEIHVWAGYAENTPSLNNIFLGLIEVPTPSLDSSGGDQLTITGHDYIVELLKATVTEVYYNKTVDFIVKDLISKYCETVKAGAQVQSTGYTVDRIEFKHQSLFECLKDLAVIGDGTNEYDFWLSTRKEFYFKQKGTSSSGKTLTVGTNILSQNFGPDITNTFEGVRVFGIGKPDTNNVVEQTTANASIDFGKSTTYQKVAQTFILGKSSMFDFVVKPGTTTGTPTTDIVFELQETTTGAPDGTVLSSYIVKNADWLAAATAGETITVALDAVVDPSLTYAVVVYPKENSLSDSSYYAVATNSGGGYASGERLYYNGSSWTGSGGGVDLYFKAFPRLPNAIELTNSSVKADYNVSGFYEDFEKYNELRTADALSARANVVFSEKTSVPFKGSITTLGLDDVHAGELINVVIPNSGINDSYEIIELTHELSKSGYVSSVLLDTSIETLNDVVANHEKRLRLLESQESTSDEGMVIVSNLEQGIVVDNSPDTNLKMYEQLVNKDIISGMKNCYHFNDNLVDFFSLNNGALRSATYDVPTQNSFGTGKFGKCLDFIGSVFPVSELSGSDIIPFGKSGTLANGSVTGATLTTDRFGTADSAYSFDGASNQYITGSSGAVPSNVTISIWVKAEGSQISENIYPAGYSGKFSFLGPNGGTTRRLGVITRNSANSDYVYYYWQDETSVDPYDGNWHMYTIAMDDTYMYCWVDGVSCGSPKAHSDNIDLVNSTNFLIGTWTTTYGHHTGKIDDVHIFNRALTSTEVLALYNKEVVASGQDLSDAHYYPFTGNANDGSKIITKVAQSFVAPEDGTLHLLGFKRAATTGTISVDEYIEIWDDSGGSPNAKVGSLTWNWNASNWNYWSTTTDDYVRTQLINEALTPGATYWLVFYKASNDSSAFPNVYYNSANDHGALKIYDGSSWTTETGSLRFALGYTDWVALDSDITLAPNSFSVSWWMKTSSTAYECLFSNGALGSAGQIEVNKNANCLRFESKTNSTFALDSMTTGITVSDGEWHHYVLTSGSSAFKLYVDGAMTYETTANTDTADQTFEMIGALQTAPNATYGLGFSGSMDDVRFYNKELSVEEVTVLFEKTEDSTGYTWFFGVPPLFSTPIKLGGGSGTVTEVTLTGVSD